ncbi:apolipoprotein B receptor-like isoform X2 [Gadus chalcogrammus]|nr:apolipoprotein B receptor-like isoform X2 [Gadus chalcogrammus]
MTKEFRDAVQSESSYIDAQLKDLFLQLKTSSPTTENIICKLGIENVWEQQDAAQYFEKILSLASPEASKVFHGRLIHQTSCLCGDRTNEHNSFWTLNLPINNAHNGVYNVEDGLKGFFSQSTLTGDNQVYCDKCEAKRDTTTECEVELYPKVIVLLLKRFEFNYCIMDYVKNDCPVDVPLGIEMAKGVSYELYATVDHVGNLSGGHYTATIQSPDDGGCWYDFNDSRVAPKNNFNPERSQSGYLLFYRKRERQMSDSPQEDHHGSSVDPVESETILNNADDGNADLTKRVDVERGDDVRKGVDDPESVDVERGDDVRKGVDLSERGEDTGGDEVTVGVDVPEGVEVTGGDEVTEGVDVTERGEVTEGVDVPERGEVTGGDEVTEGVDVPEGGEVTGGDEVTEGVDVPEGGEVTGGDEVTEGVDVPERGEVTGGDEVTEGVDVPEGGEVTGGDVVAGDPRTLESARLDGKGGERIKRDEELPTNEMESRKPGDQAGQQEASGTAPPLSDLKGRVTERRRGEEGQTEGGVIQKTDDGHDSGGDDHHSTPSSSEPMDERPVSAGSSDVGPGDPLLTKSERSDRKGGERRTTGVEVPTNEKESREPGDQARQQEASGTIPKVSDPESRVNERKRGRRESMELMEVREEGEGEGGVIQKKHRKVFDIPNCFSGLCLSSRPRLAKRKQRLGSKADKVKVKKSIKKRLKNNGFLCYNKQTSDTE